MKCLSPSNKDTGGISTRPFDSRTRPRRRGTLVAWPPDSRANRAPGTARDLLAPSSLEIEAAPSERTSGAGGAVPPRARPDLARTPRGRHRPPVPARRPGGSPVGDLVLGLPVPWDLLSPSFRRAESRHRGGVACAHQRHDPAICVGVSTAYQPPARTLSRSLRDLSRCVTPGGGCGPTLVHGVAPCPGEWGRGV